MPYQTCSKCGEPFDTPSATVLVSGTTGMVAKQLGREFLGFEINPEYARMAERRIANVTASLFSEPTGGTVGRGA